MLISSRKLHAFYEGRDTWLITEYGNFVSLKLEMLFGSDKTFPPLRLPEASGFPPPQGFLE
jgi:hypothetical protein